MLAKLQFFAAFWIIHGVLGQVPEPEPAANFLVASFHGDVHKGPRNLKRGKGGCRLGELDMSVAVKVGGCINRHIMWGDDFLSYEIVSCVSDMKNSIVSVKRYAHSDCSGEGEMSEMSISDDCDHGMHFSCEAQPVGMILNWPTVGMSFSDTTCADPSVLVLAKPQCNSRGRDVWSDDTEFAWKWIKDTEGGTCSFMTYSSLDACLNNVPSNTVTAPIGECLAGGKLAEQVGYLLDIASGTDPRAANPYEGNFLLM